MLASDLDGIVSQRLLAVPGTLSPEQIFVLEPAINVSVDNRTTVLDSALRQQLDRVAELVGRVAGNARRAADRLRDVLQPLVHVANHLPHELVLFVSPSYVS